MTILCSGASSGRLYKFHFVLSKMGELDLTPFHLSYITELILFVINFCSVLNSSIQSSGKCIIMFIIRKYNY